MSSREPLCINLRGILSILISRWGGVYFQTHLQVSREGRV
ncbi:hypothetical protein BN903_79 [Halorubrum sp. AJ67]|nr:hypothetical protein BN903_79 [Halorubrum sp. AJ67]